MLTLRLAWRSFLRYRRRSLISGAAIALGLAMMLVFVGVAEDAHERMIDIGVHLGSGHVVIQGRGYQEDQTLAHVVADPAAVEAAARALPGVRGVAARVRGAGLATAGASSSAVVVAGVDPAVEPRVSSIDAPRRRVAGDYLRRSADLPFAGEPPDAYLGVTLARKLGVEPGDRLVVTVSPRGSGEPKASALRVRGLFRTGVDELDGYLLEMPLDQAQALYDLGGAVTQVAVLLDDTDDAAGAAARLGRALPDSLEVLPWQQALRELHEAVVLDDASLYLIMAVVFVIVAIGIFNTVLMSVIERTRELGVLAALGTSAGRLFAGVVAEAAVLGVVAAAVGLAVGLALHAWLASHGLDVAALYGGDLQFSGIAFEGRVYSALTPRLVLQWTVIVIALVVASALYPAWRACRLEPVEAMRHA